METLKRAALPFLVSRLLVCFLLSLPLLIKIQPVPTPTDAGILYHLQPEDGSGPFWGRLATVLRSADSTWYLQIAEQGYTKLTPEQQAVGANYTSVQRNWCFFPLFPLIEKMAAPFFGSAFRAGTALSQLFFFAALIVLIKLAEEHGIPPPAADRAVWLLCIFPFSYFFSFPLTESLFLLLSSAAFYLAAIRWTLSAGLVMALVSATRPTGLLLLPAFAFELYQNRKQAGLQRSSAALLLAPAGTALFALYLWQITGSPWAFSINQQAWGRPSISAYGLFTALSAPFNKISGPWDIVLLNSASAYLMLACTGWAICKRRYSWALFMLVPLLAVLGTGITQSFGRFTAISYPVFLILSQWTENKTAERIVMIICAALLGILTICRAFYVTSVMC